MVKRLKRRDARLFWVLFLAFWVLEIAAWALRLAGEGRPGLLSAASWITVLAFLPLLGATALWCLRLRCPNCRSRDRSSSARLNPRKTDTCKGCGQPILFNDQE